MTAAKSAVVFFLLFLRRLKKTEKFTAMYALSFTAVYSYAPSIQKSHKAKNATQIKAYTANPKRKPCAATRSKLPYLRALNGIEKYNNKKTASFGYKILLLSE